MRNILEYSQYKNPQVRALAWSVLSPGLVNESDSYSTCVSSDWCNKLYEDLRPFLKQLDSHPKELMQWLEQYQSWRLGIRFEAYWCFILEYLKKQCDIQSYCDHIQIQSINEQPKKHSITLGELDFVYQGIDKELNHLEIAAKFYLLKPDASGFERLVGANGGDWYERKLEHLFKKQLPLSDLPQTKKVLSEEFDLEVANIQCHHHGLMKGMIFFPINEDEKLNDHEKKYLNPNHLAGRWGTVNNWYLSDPGEIGRWLILEKLDWLVPQVYSSSCSDLDDILLTMKEMTYKLKGHFYNSRRSLLLAHLTYDDETQLWLERQRIMVVDKYWPDFNRSIDSILKQSEKRPRGS
ncbi:MAG: DUF1853 family protein [Gammaproteobacteria bacterium]|nr:DUF1853 family protein [Gammaproteobacteria bacterium]